MKSLSGRPAHARLSVGASSISADSPGHLEFVHASTTKWHRLRKLVCCQDCQFRPWPRILVQALELLIKLGLGLAKAAGCNARRPSLPSAVLGVQGR